MADNIYDEVLKIKDHKVRLIYNNFNVKRMKRI